MQRVEGNAKNGQVCAYCGKVFTCGMLAGAERCWCADLVPAMAVPKSTAGCYCPDCLRRNIAELTPSADRD